MEIGVEYFILCILFIAICICVAPMILYSFKHSVCKFSVKKAQQNAVKIELKTFSFASILPSVIYTALVLISCYMVNLSLCLTMFVVSVFWLLVLVSKIFNKGYFFEKDGIRFGFWYIAYNDFNDVEFHVDRVSLEPHLLHIIFSKENNASVIYLDESLIEKRELKKFIRELKARDKKVKISVTHLRTIRKIINGTHK